MLHFLLELDAPVRFFPFRASPGPVGYSAPRRPPKPSSHFPFSLFDFPAHILRRCARAVYGPSQVTSHQPQATLFALPFFSVIYELPNLQPLCFDHVATVPGWVGIALPTKFRIFFQVPYAPSLLFSHSSQNCRGGGYSSRFGNRHAQKVEEGWCEPKRGWPKRGALFQGPRGPTGPARHRLRRWTGKSPEAWRRGMATAARLRTSGGIR